ncbi:MAG: lipocalin family protein [Bdellovibrio sp.]|jgi:apolipoprotein D and lipocalin family protein
MPTNLPPQPTVEHVEIPRFMGTWYVIATIPTMFETGAHNAVETYTWNESENRVDVDFRFRKDAFDGKEKAIPQKGFIYNQTTKAEWRIQPFWPLSFAYLIVDLAPDYSDTIIGVPNRKYVWIMARQPQMQADRYQALVTKVQTLGYDISKLILVPQQPLSERQK